MNIEKIKKELKTNYIGKEIHYFSELDSTNEKAKNIANKKVIEGSIVIAGKQKAGKGRLNRKWSSPIGGIYLSIILTPKISPSKASKLVLLTAVCVTKSLNHFGLSAGIKWPNDVLINGKKICGILTEMSANMGGLNYIVVGIGINANVDIEQLPPELQKNSTSIKNELGKEISINELIIKILSEFERLYEIFQTSDFTNIIKEWKRLSLTLGKNVKIITKNEIIKGTAIDIDNHGALLIDTGIEIKRVISGDCVHLNQDK